jgi:hypothetical protein
MLALGEGFTSGLTGFSGSRCGRAGAIKLGVMMTVRGVREVACGVPSLLEKVLASARLRRESWSEEIMRSI